MAAKKSILPATIEICGHVIEVVGKPLVNDMGEFDIDEMRIYIDTGRTPEQQLETLYHECIHAVLGLGGVAYALDEKTEEAIVRCIQYGLWPLIKFRNIG
jgi:hypothetical protein